MSDIAKHGAGNASIGDNMKSYAGGWTGNASVSTAPISEIAENVGRGAAAVSALADTVNLARGNLPAWKYGLNRVVDGIGLFGGPVGELGAETYYAIDTFYPGGIQGFANDSLGALQKASNAEQNGNPSYIASY